MKTGIIEAGGSFLNLSALARNGCGRTIVELCLNDHSFQQMF